MLAKLKELIARHAIVSSYLIDAADGMPTSAAYRSRFGSLLGAYRLAGYTPPRDYSFVEANRRLRTMYPTLVDDVVSRLASVDATVRRDAQTGFLIINEQYTASMFLSRCRHTEAGSLRWLIRLDQQIAPDVTILVRMDAANQAPADYYLLPIMDIPAPKLLLCETNGAALDTYQFDSLDYFTTMAKRRKIEVAA
jgi:hypothetical protein